MACLTLNLVDQCSAAPNLGQVPGQATAIPSGLELWQWAAVTLEQYSLPR